MNKENELEPEELSEEEAKVVVGGWRLHDLVVGGSLPNQGPIVMPCPPCWPTPGG